MVQARSRCGARGAQQTLGLCYFLGDGVDVDIREGIKWITRVAEAEDAKAQDLLGDI